MFKSTLIYSLTLSRGIQNQKGLVNWSYILMHIMIATVSKTTECQWLGFLSVFPQRETQTRQRCLMLSLPLSSTATTDQGGPSALSWRPYNHGNAKFPVSPESVQDSLLQLDPCTSMGPDGALLENT